VNRKM